MRYIGLALRLIREVLRWGFLGLFDRLIILVFVVPDTTLLIYRLLCCVYILGTFSFYWGYQWVMYFLVCWFNFPVPRFQMFIWFVWCILLSIPYLFFQFLYSSYLLTNFTQLLVWKREIFILSGNKVIVKLSNMIWFNVCCWLIVINWR